MYFAVVVAEMVNGVVSRLQGRAGGIWVPGGEVSERSLFFPSSTNASCWVDECPTATLCYSHTCREVRQQQDWGFCSGSTSIASRTTDVSDMELESAVQ